MSSDIRGAVGALFISLLLCGSAGAQTVFSTKEGSTADAAAKLLKDPNAVDDPAISDSLAEGGADTETIIKDSKIKGKTLDSVVVNVPDANPVSVLNCSGKKVVVKAYNSNDTVVIVPFEAKTIASGQAASLKCKTKSCRLRVGTGKATDAMSGYLRLENGFSKSNQSNLQDGC